MILCEFILNDFERIIVEIEGHSEEIDCFVEASISLLRNNSKILLNHDSLQESIYRLQGLLSKVLDGGLELHESINKDIGYLYNEDLQWTFNEDLTKRPAYLLREEPQESKCWIGSRYNLWCYDYQSWLYNKDGEIFFELTSIYPGHYGEKEDQFDYIKYNQWMKTYKPFLITKISRETAQAWLTQANDILQTIRENVERMEREHLMSA